MDIQFFNGNHVPKPREEVKIENVKIIPYPEGTRIHIEVEVTPFSERPNLILAIHDENDNLVSELNIIETMHFNMEFTMHLRGIEDPEGAYSLTVELFYENRKPPQSQVIEGFTIPQEEEV